MVTNSLRVDLVLNGNVQVETRGIGSVGVLVNVDVGAKRESASVDVVRDDDGGEYTEAVEDVEDVGGVKLVSFVKDDNSEVIVVGFDPEDEFLVCHRPVRSSAFPMAPRAASWTL